MNRENFRYFLSRKSSRSKSGKPSKNTPTRYLNALEKIVNQDFSIDIISELIQRNIFEMSDPYEFDCLRKRIVSDDYFKVANKYGNGDLQAALNNYYNFLEEVFIFNNIHPDMDLDEIIAHPSYKYAQTKKYDRMRIVIRKTLKKANGICQLCNQYAPFLDDKNKPFLEVHHIIYLSRGGSDNEENTVALCPNCHRKVHILNSEEDLTKLQYVKKMQYGKR